MCEVTINATEIPQAGLEAETILGREEILCTEPKEDCAIEHSVPGREGGLEGELCE